MADETIRIVIQGEDNLSRPAGQASSALGGLQKAAQGSSGALGSLAAAAASPARALSGLVDTLGRVGLAAMGIQALASSIAGLARGMVSGNAEFERYEVQFGVLLGSATEAKKRIADLTEFAKVTPFELPEVVRADKILVAFGLDAADTAKRFGVSAEQIRTTVGDAASGAGVSFEMLAIAFGRFASGATGEAIQRFQELGIATREQMAAWGMEFSKAGQLLTPAREAFTILEKHVREKYGGMMDAQSRTFEGMLSNLADWFGQTKGMLMAPLFDVLKEQLQGLLTTLNSSEAKLAISNLGLQLATAVNVGMQAIKQLSSSWTTMSGEAQRKILAIAVLFVAGGPLLKGMGLAVAGVRGIALAFGALERVAYTTTVRIATGLTVVGLGLLGAEQAARKTAESSDALADSFERQAIAHASEEAEYSRLLFARAAQMREAAADARRNADLIGTPWRAAGDLAADVGAVFDETISKALGIGLASEESGDMIDRALRAAIALAEEYYQKLARIEREQLIATRSSAEWDAMLRTQEEMATGFRVGEVSAAALAETIGEVGKAAKSAGILLGEMVRALIAMHPAILAAASAVASWSRQVEAVNLALAANRDQMEAAQAAYQGMQDRLSALNEQLAEQQRILAELATPRLQGMGLLEKQISAVERQLKRLSLAEMGLPSLEEIRAQYAGLQRTMVEGGTTFTVTGISTQEAKAKLQELRRSALEKVMSAFPEMTAEIREYLSALPMTEEGLRKAMETLQLTKDLKFDEALAKIKEAAEGVKEEMTFDVALRQIAETKARITELTGEINAQEVAMRAQRAIIVSIEAAAKALNATLALYQQQLAEAQTKQTLLNDALSLAYQWFLDDREKMTEMGAEGVRVAGVMDEKTRALLASISSAASDTTTMSSATLAAMVTQYKLDMARAVDEVGRLSGALNSIPTTITTVHTTVHRDVYEAAPEGTAVSPEVPAYQYGGAFTVGGSGGPDSQLVRFMASPGEHVTVTPPGQGVRGGLDYDRLGIAIVRALRGQGGRYISQTINNYAGGQDAGQSYLSLRAAAGV